jgi:prepilin-type N-terminal cleavage/methylation domain-containing protein
MQKKCAQGFSLLEVLVALAIFGIFLGGFVTLQLQEQLLLRNAAELLHARLIANETMETLKARPFAELNSYSFTNPAKLKEMTVNVTVSNFGSEALKKIVIAVQWRGVNDQPRHLALATLRVQDGLVVAEGEAAATGPLMIATTAGEQGGKY